MSVINENGKITMDDLLNPAPVMPEPSNPEPSVVSAVDPAIEPEPPVLNPQDFGGDRFDAMGNLVKDGAVIKRKSDIDAEIAAKVGVDNTPVEASVSAEGDLVDSTGKVLKKKGEFTLSETGEVVTNDDSFVKSLMNQAIERGYSFTGEDGNPIEFEDSTEGYYELTQAIAQQEASSSIESWLDSNSEIKNLHLHMQAGGNPLDYYSSKVNVTDYTQLDNPTETLDQEILVIDMYRKLYNMPEKEAKEMATLIKDANNLEVKSREALASLKTWQKETEIRNIEANKAAIAEEREIQIRELKTIHSTIQNGNLGNFKIPDTKKAAFYDYLTREVEAGTTQSLKDYNALSVDKKLMMEYLLFTGLDVDRLIELRVKSAQADLIKDRSKGKPIIVRSTQNFQKQGTDVPKLEELK